VLFALRFWVRYLRAFFCRCCFCSVLVIFVVPFALFVLRLRSALWWVPRILLVVVCRSTVIAVYGSCFVAVDRRCRCAFVPFAGIALLYPLPLLPLPLPLPLISVVVYDSLRCLRLLPGWCVAFVPLPRCCLPFCRYHRCLPPVIRFCRYVRSAVLVPFVLPVRCCGCRSTFVVRVADCARVGLCWWHYLPLCGAVALPLRSFATLLLSLYVTCYGCEYVVMVSLWCSFCSAVNTTVVRVVFFVTTILPLLWSTLGTVVVGVRCCWYALPSIRCGCRYVLFCDAICSVLLCLPLRCRCSVAVRSALPAGEFIYCVA